MTTIRTASSALEVNSVRMMSEVPEIRTARLTLRGWTDDDRASYAAVNADRLVMATLGPLMSREESDAHVDHMMAKWDERGFGLWCVDRDGECIGFTGLNVPWFETDFTREAAEAGYQCVEVGWRLKSEHWGDGLAPEAAAASLRFGWDVLGLPEIFSWTAESNHKSRRVMEKIGMVHDHSVTFDHPGVKPGWKHLNPHVLYRIATPLSQPHSRHRTLPTT
jgi:RimJ/RimL family protein N-acetyltransferase